MIHVAFYIAVGWILTILRISAFGGLGAMGPDFVTPLIMFLGLYAPRSRGMAISLILGFICDSLAGGILGPNILAFTCIFYVGQFVRRGFVIESFASRSVYLISLTVMVRVILAGALWSAADDGVSAWNIVVMTPAGLVNNLILGMAYIRIFRRIDDIFGWLPADDMDLEAALRGGR